MTASIGVPRDPQALLNLTILSYGVRTKVRIARVLLPLLRSELPPGSRFIADRRAPGGWTARTEAEVANVVSHVEFFVAQHAPGLIFVHAAAVSFDGHALLVPGRTLSGKSTLAAALVQAGGTYLSDEFAGLTSDGLVVPYARALQIRETDTMPSYRWSAGDMPAVASGPLPVALILNTEFTVAGRTRFEPMSPSAMMASLMGNTLAAQARTQEMLVHCAAAVKNAIGLSGPRGEAGEAASILLDHLRAVSV
ncbi:MAG: hypothetical protein JWM76_5129 [Pseudonocardiales bacterium]|nr:hypothetical protein [Pseudonocardiales bacterium]